jgi:hypothetical protein
LTPFCVAHVTHLPAFAHALQSRTDWYQAKRDSLAILQPGLAGVVTRGTAKVFAPIVARLQKEGWEVYGKTGTLVTTDRHHPTSRMMLCILRRGGNGSLERGVALSLVIERSHLGEAASQLNTFVQQNLPLLLQAADPSGAMR